MLLVLCNSECVLTFVGNKEINEMKYHNSCNISETGQGKTMVAIDH